MAGLLRSHCMPSEVDAEGLAALPCWPEGTVAPACHGSGGGGSSLFFLKVPLLLEGGGLALSTVLLGTNILLRGFAGGGTRSGLLKVSPGGLNRRADGADHGPGGVPRGCF